MRGRSDWLRNARCKVSQVPDNHSVTHSFHRVRPSEAVGSCVVCEKMAAVYPVAPKESPNDDILVSVQVHGGEGCSIGGKITVALVDNGEVIRAKRVSFQDNQQVTMDVSTGLAAQEATKSDPNKISSVEPTDGGNGCGKYHFPSLNSAIHAAGSCCSFAAHVVRDASLELVHRIHLPAWLQDNEFMHFGHRQQTDSFKECLKSVFTIHSETGNIWTHLIGCIMMILLAIYFLAGPGFALPVEDKIFVLPYFVGAISCLGMSTFFHTVICHSEQVKVFFNKLDYVGVVLIIVGGAWPWFHFGFYCYREWQILYTSIMILIGALTLPLLLLDRCQSHEYALIRVATKGAMFVFGAIPTIHFYILSNYQMPIKGFFQVITIIGSGAAMYIFQIPERFFPGKCDIWFHSHQILHLFVLLGIVAFYRAILEMAAIKQMIGCP